MRDYIGAAPEVLLAGGVEMAEVSRVIADLRKEIDWTSATFSYSAHGEDHFTHILDQAYLPSAEACSQFVRLLADLIVHHGQSVVTSGQVLSKADMVAIDVVGKK